MTYSLSFVLVLILVGQLLAAESDKNCENGKRFKNNPDLFPELKGYFYLLYASDIVINNEVVKFVPKGNDSICARITNDGNCCRSVNITLGKEYQPTDIKSDDDEDCTTKLSESGEMKMITSNTDTDGSFCILLWACRKSRYGVQTYCTTRKASNSQFTWIAKQHVTRFIRLQSVKQSEDFKDGKCFKNESN